MKQNFGAVVNYILGLSPCEKTLKGPYRGRSRFSYKFASPFKRFAIGRHWRHKLKHFYGQKVLSNALNRTCLAKH